jgi:hypothetical protein
VQGCRPNDQVFHGDGDAFGRLFALDSACNLCDRE